MAGVSVPCNLLPKSLLSNFPPMWQASKDLERRIGEALAQELRRRSEDAESEYNFAEKLASHWLGVPLSFHKAIMRSVFVCKKGEF